MIYAAKEKYFSKRFHFFIPNPAEALPNPVIYFWYAETYVLYKFSYVLLQMTYFCKESFL